MHKKLISLFSVLSLLIISACSSTTPFTIDEDLSRSKMESSSEVSLNGEAYYPASELSTKPQEMGNRMYEVTSGRTQRGTTSRSAIYREPAEYVKYGILIDARGKIQGIIPIEDQKNRIEAVRLSYQRVYFEPAMRNGEAVNSYLIVEEQF